MKFYEIFHNSCQKSGSGGYTISSMTEGTPTEYVDAIRPLLYRYDAGLYKGANQTELFKDTSLILKFPVRYAYKKVSLEGGKKLYVLLRIVPLGFDYSYYLSGKATRLGNHCHHVIIFDEEPSASVFDIFYEEPQNGSFRFAPEDRVPYQENAEMRALMLCEKPIIPASDKPFSSAHAENPSEGAYNTFFHYIEARRSGKRLVISCQEDRKTGLIADFYRLLFSYAGQTTFDSGVYTDGAIDEAAVNVTFINEYYNQVNSGEMQEGYSSKVFCKASEAPDTEEYQKYKDLLKSLMNSGNLKNAAMVSEWLLSKDYEKVSGIDNDTSHAFLWLCNIPEILTVEDCSNRELMRLVGSKLEASSRPVAVVQERLQEKLRTAVAGAGIDGLIDAVKFLKESENLGIDIKRIVETDREKVCELILSSESNLVHVYSGLDRALFERFVVREQFAQKAAYLKSDEVKPFIQQLYPYFFDSKRSAFPFLLKFYIQAPDGVQWLTLLRDSSPEASYREGVYIMAVDKTPHHVDRLWKLFYDDLKDSMSKDLVSELSAHQSDPAFAELFYHSIRQRASRQPELVLKQGRELALKNEAYLSLLVGGEKKNRVYGQLFDSVVSDFRAGDAKRMKALIKESVIDCLGGKIDVTDWSLLYMILEGNLEESLDRQYHIARKLSDKSYFNRIAYKRLDGISKMMDVQSIVEDIVEQKDFDREEYLKHIGAFSGQKLVKCLGCWMKAEGMSFKEALKLLDDINSACREDVLSSFYQDEYKSYVKREKMKNGIKNFFRRLFKKGDDKAPRSPKKSKKK